MEMEAFSIQASLFSSGVLKRVLGGGELTHTRTVLLLYAFTSAAVNSTQGRAVAEEKAFTKSFRPVESASLHAAEVQYESNAY